MKKPKKIGGYLAIGALVLTGVVGTSTAAFAGADAGTIGDGYTIYPTVSPFISYAVVTQCQAEPGGTPVAWRYRGEVTLGSAVAYGGTGTVATGDNSAVTLRKVGTYSGTWRCKNLG